MLVNMAESYDKAIYFFSIRFTNREGSPFV